jgi:hypothetical protein
MLLRTNNEKKVGKEVMIHEGKKNEGKDSTYQIGCNG